MKMKISQLKQIIKEELDKIIQQDAPPSLDNKEFRQFAMEYLDVNVEQPNTEHAVPIAWELFNKPMIQENWRALAKTLAERCNPSIPDEEDDEEEPVDESRRDKRYARMQNKRENRKKQD